MRGGVSEIQMVFWMRELTEITLLDFIFSQQDRVGNIDYQAFWTWWDGTAVQHRLARSAEPPADLAAQKPVRLRRTWLNDNDAGGRVEYANFAKSTGMLEKLHHYPADLYRRLMALDRDLSASGPIHQHLQNDYILSAAQLGQIVKNVAKAAQLLRGQCEAGALQFDLDPEALPSNRRVRTGDGGLRRVAAT